MDKPFGKYTLVERLGGGGMAEVFKARLVGPGGFEKFLALKLILPHHSEEPEFVGMFTSEATLAARLDHANIVRIVEFDQIEGRYYIAMELVDGRDLRQVLARAAEANRPLTLGECLLITLEVSRGLAFAHGELASGMAEIVHRDISPHNLILSRAGEVKITDFGIAKLASAGTVTRTGVIKGKLCYMSPEQATGDWVDHRSDLFSLGCVLWEMVVGRRLFAGRHDLELLERLKNAPIPSASEFNPQVPPEVDRLLAELLQRDRERRLASASALGVRIEELLRAQPALERSVALAQLYRDLFGVEAVRRITAVMPEPPGAEPVVDSPVPLAAAAASAGDVGYPAGSQVQTLPEVPTRPAVTGVWGGRWLALGIFLLAVVGAVLFTGLFLLRPPPALPDPPGGFPGRPELDLSASADESALEGLLDPEPGLDDLSVSISEPAVVDPSAPQSAVGLLELNAIPWARVSWRGRHLGETPLERVELPAGEHVLVLENSSLARKRSIRVRIVPGATTTQLVDLRRP